VLGDGGAGIGDWAQSPIPNPQSPIPNPQSPLKKIIFLFLLKFDIILKLNMFLKLKFFIYEQSFEINEII